MPCKSPATGKDDYDYSSTEFVLELAKALAESVDTLVPRGDSAVDMHIQLLLPRVETEALLSRHLDPYYHGYTSPLEYERNVRKLAFPLDLSGKSRGGQYSKKGKKQKTQTAEETKDHGPALAVYATPGGWIDQQRQTHRGGINLSLTMYLPVAHHASPS